MVVLHFNEPVTPLVTRLIAPDGASEDLTSGAIGGENVTVELPPGVTQGTFVMSWRVVSTDGHPIAGSLVFSVGSVTGVAASDEAGDRTVSVLLWATKAMHFVAMFVGIGGTVFGSITPLPSAAWIVAAAFSAIGIVLVPATLGLQGLDALGLPFSAALDGEPWAAGLSTSYGSTAIAALVAFACSIVALQLPLGRVASAIGILGGVTAALSLALSGHASATEPQWLTRPAVFVHIAGIMFWVGALFPLWLLLRDRSEAGDKALAVFSRAIPFAVAPLLLSGIVLSVIQMGFPGPDWLAPYGFILAAKLGLLLVLLGLAYWEP